MNLTTIVEGLPGWCTPEKAQALFDLVIATDSQSTVELGVFGGRSLIPMALAHKQKGSGMITGIDPYAVEPSLEGTNHPANDEYWKSINYEQVYNNCKRALITNGVNEICWLLRSKSVTVANSYGDNSVDIIHQDSVHSKEVIIAELEAWSSKLKPGGYWIVDDTNWPETVEGYAELPNFGMELVTDYESWQIWKKKE